MRLPPDPGEENGRGMVIGSAVTSGEDTVMRRIHIGVIATGRTGIGRDLRSGHIGGTEMIAMTATAETAIAEARETAGRIEMGEIIVRTDIGTVRRSTTVLRGAAPSTIVLPPHDPITVTQIAATQMRGILDLAETTAVRTEGTDPTGTMAGTIEVPGTRTEIPGLVPMQQSKKKFGKRGSPRCRTMRTTWSRHVANALPMLRPRRRSSRRETIGSDRNVVVSSRRCISSCRRTTWMSGFAATVVGCLGWMMIEPDLLNLSLFNFFQNCFFFFIFSGFIVIPLAFKWAMGTYCIRWKLVLY